MFDDLPSPTPTQSLYYLYLWYMLPTVLNMQVKREDLFLTLLVGEDLPRSEGAEGLAGVVRKMLASGGDGGGVAGAGESSLGYVDALVLMRESGRCKGGRGGRVVMVMVVVVVIVVQSTPTLCTK